MDFHVLHLAAFTPVAGKRSARSGSLKRGIGTLCNGAGDTRLEIYCRGERETMRLSRAHAAWETIPDRP
jgi:hypothetical protein